VFGGFREEVECASHSGGEGGGPFDSQRGKVSIGGCVRREKDLPLMGDVPGGQRGYGGTKLAWRTT